MKQLSFIFLILIAACLLQKTSGAKPTNPNLAIRQAAEEICLQLPQADSAIGLIPLTSRQADLKAACDILTRLLAARLVAHVGERFIGIDGVDWHDFPASNGLLSISRAKRYGNALRCKRLLTGRLSRGKPHQPVQGTLFLWDTTTGYLDYYVEFKTILSVSSSIFSAPSPHGEEDPYYLKWKGLPDKNLACLALDVADVNGNGYNELIVAEANRIKALRWNGVGFDKPADLADVQYREEESPITDRERRTMLSTDQDESDRDELYIASPPNITWRIEWLEDGSASISKHSPMIVAYGADFFIAATTGTNQSGYEAHSTVFFIRDATGNHGTQPSALRVNYHSVASRILNANASDRSGEIVMIDSDGHLRAYRINPSTAGLLWQTPPLFGERIAVGDLNGDGMVEIATTLGAPAERRNVEPYDQFVVLERRDGLYTVAWKSPLLDGKIVDLKIDDSDNDDRDELILCLRNRSGSQIRLYAATKYLD